MVNWNPAWAKAIANIESRGSGGYGAIGPKTKKGNRAYGRYQVMDFNIPSWTEEHFGKRLTPAQFLANPKAQDAVFRGEFGDYVGRYGNPQDAASMWFTGKPLKAGAGNKDILGTTGQGYVNKFNKELGGTDMAQANPNILSSLFGGGNTSEPFVAREPQGLLERFGLQKMVEGAEGETGQKFYNRDSFLDLVSRFGAVASDNPVAQQMALDGINRRANRRKSNRTAEYLNSIGQTDLANAIGQGLITGPEAMDRLFKLDDAQREAALEAYRYGRDLRDRRADTQSDRDYQDAVRAAQREQELADIQSSREYQDAVREITQANSIELARIKDELLNNPNSLKNQLLLEELEIQQTRLASDLATADVNRQATEANTKATEASTAGQLIENEAAQAELDAAKNPPEVTVPTLEQNFEPIDIAKFAAGDFAGLFDRGWNQLSTRLWGGEGTGLSPEASNVASINNAIRIGLSRALTDRGSKYSSQQIDELLPKIGDSNTDQYNKVKDLIITLNQQMATASSVAKSKDATAKMRLEAEKVLQTFPNLIPVLEESVRNYEVAKGLGTTDAYTEEEQAIDDQAQQIIGGGT